MFEARTSGRWPRVLVLCTWFVCCQKKMKPFSQRRLESNRSHSSICRHVEKQTCLFIQSSDTTSKHLYPRKFHILEICHDLTLNLDHNCTVIVSDWYVWIPFDKSLTVFTVFRLWPLSEKRSAIWNKGVCLFASVHTCSVVCYSPKSSCIINVSIE